MKRGSTKGGARVRHRSDGGGEREKKEGLWRGRFRGGSEKKKLRVGLGPYKS